MTFDFSYKTKLIFSAIRNKRERLSYSQEYVAMKLGVSQNAYSKMELGYTRVTLERLFFIAAILDVDIAELLAA